MKRKLRVGILFGGRSGEHEVSLLSAASVLEAISTKKYEVVPVGITKEGRWVTSHDARDLLAGENAKALRTGGSGETSSGGAQAHGLKELRAGDPERTSAAAVLRRGEAVILPPVPPRKGAATSLTLLEIQAGAEVAAPGHARDQTGNSLDQAGSALVQVGSHASDQALEMDVVFPVLHGTFGEDGTIQGLLELADIAYVGSGVLGSSAGMDKDVMKRLFMAAKLPIVKHVAVLRSDWKSSPRKCVKAIEAALKYPLFVKPANLGSSVGISKVHDRSELAPAMDLAASFDRKLVVEQGVGGKGKPRELEVAVLGNDNPVASVVGEIVPGKEFYDYEAKYLSEGSVPIIPAKLTRAESKQVREMAIAAFKACDCSGLARVDFLMDPAPKPGSKPAKAPRIYLNEINTMPGFTSISMYPKLWAASGLAYPKLIDRLIELALERHSEKQETQFARS